MIISIWRYSHLVLAVSSVVFIVIAALTGIVLSFEPISYQLTDYKVSGAEQITLAEALKNIDDHYDEIFNLEVDQNGLVTLSAIDKNGNMGDFYIDPLTGNKLGEVEDQSPLFEFATSLHRSLFLKSTGRFFIGLCSFCLLLIAITGIILVAKRQQGIRHFFNKIIKENFYQYYHVYLGRLALIPILVISLTGTYLFLQRFSIFPEADKPKYDINDEALKELPSLKIAHFPVFRSVTLDDLRSLEFPFSPDVEDYFTLKLKTKELLINQFTGEVLGESAYPVVSILSDLSLTLHTGRGSIWWSVVLGFTAVSILFFVYSGFVLTFKRKAIKIKNHLKKDRCKHIILIGSETGTTIPFAMQLHQQLLESGESSYVTEMNKYESFKSMQNLIIITSTYGQGKAPANAIKFMQKYQENAPQHHFSYAVVGFGSLAYPDFCQFAIEVDQMLNKTANAQPLMALQNINNRSWEAFRQWARHFGEATKLSISLPAKNPVELKPKKTIVFEVLNKTAAENSPDNTFLVELSNTSNGIKSGDLIGIYPPAEHERLYSMAIMPTGNILLSIKRHQQGVCSNYLNDLSIGAEIEATIIKNKNFHFPVKAGRVVLISTGTGIAPFLGMLAQNLQKVETHLYWGARNEASLLLYEAHINEALCTSRLTNFQPAYSRAKTPKTYVQDLIYKDEALIAQTLKEKGVIMICGSTAMQREVTNVLEEVCLKYCEKKLSYYQNRGQIKIDCY